MNRRDLRQLSEMRLREARALLRSRCYSGAYYLAGYAVECALKATIAKKTRKFDFPDKDIAYKVYTHKLGELLLLAGLESDLKKQPRQLQLSWNIVQSWNEKSRYKNWNRAAARALISAIDDASNGVMQWIRRHW